MITFLFRAALPHEAKGVKWLLCIVIHMDDDKLNRVLRHKDVHVYDMSNDRVRVAVNWDDLNPEPRRSKEIRELEDARRELIDNGFDVSEMSRGYGRAYVTVLGE